MLTLFENTSNSDHEQVNVHVLGDSGSRTTWVTQVDVPLPRTPSQGIDGSPLFSTWNSKPDHLRAHLNTRSYIVVTCIDT